MARYAVRKRRNLIRVQLAAVYMLTIVITAMMTSIYQWNNHERAVGEINIAHESEMEAIRFEYENKINELEMYYQYGCDENTIEQEAEYIARVIYGTARNHSTADQKAVVWCILNRVEHYAHPNTVIEVCKQPKQWMGYSDDNPVLTEHYNLAMEELKIWHNNGHRPMGNQYIYLTWSSQEILLRDTFEENRSTNYWRMR